MQLRDDVHSMEHVLLNSGWIIKSWLFSKCSSSPFTRTIVLGFKKIKKKIFQYNKGITSQTKWDQMFCHDSDTAPAVRGTEVLLWQVSTLTSESANGVHIPGASSPSAHSSHLCLSSRQSYSPSFHFSQLKSGWNWVCVSWIPRVECWCESYIHHVRRSGQCGQRDCVWECERVLGYRTTLFFCRHKHTHTRVLSLLSLGGLSYT